MNVERFDFIEIECPPGTEFVSLDGPGGLAFFLPTFLDEQGIPKTRIMPTKVGTYQWQAGRQEGKFSSIEAGRRGVLVADAWHFCWQGTGEPFFWNGTTAYMLAGLREDLAITAIDRLADHGINHIRVALCPSRQPSGERWMEPQVREREDFTFRYGPWQARNSNSVVDPDFDRSCFDHAYWAKFERLLRHARERDVIVQVIFFVDAQEPQNYPFDRSLVGDDPAERTYYREAVARLAAFSNVEWCITNEWALFRPDQWVEKIGKYISELDPYRHPLSVHGHGHFPFRSSPWCTHALFQVWDEQGAHGWALEKRREQEESGGAKPQVNEEFGYEDHYPYPWGESRIAPARSAESRARLAWEIVMGGVWCTTGESAADGDGGWINGFRRGESELLQRHRHLRAFFESFEWWKTTPSDHLVSGHAYCRAEEGAAYAVYLYGGGSTSLILPDPGPWDVTRFNPITGNWTELSRNAKLMRDPGSGPGWVSPYVAPGEQGVFLIQRSVIVT